MSAPAKPQKLICIGSLSIQLRHYADGRFGFDYVPPGAPRVKVRARLLSSAEEKAREILGAARGGKVERLSIDEDEYGEFLRWKSEQGSRAKVPDLLRAFLRSKENKGRSIHHTRRLQRDLELFAGQFTGRIDLIPRAQIEVWLDGQSVGPRRWNNLRAAVVSLYRFARREGAIDSRMSAAELIEKRRVTMKVETYTPAELLRILAVTEREWLPLIVLGAFAGLRPQELCPEPTSGKPGLMWENILWAKEKIDVPAKVSKTGKRRFVPLLPATVAFLGDRRGDEGPVCPTWTSRLTGDLGRRSGVGWRSDALRHSFASYRLALTMDMQRLALEMGNSPAMIHAHYLDMKHEDEAEEWFAIRPRQKVPKVSEGRQMDCAHSKSPDATLHPRRAHTKAASES